PWLRPRPHACSFPCARPAHVPARPRAFPCARPFPASFLAYSGEVERGFVDPRETTAVSGRVRKASCETAAVRIEGSRTLFRDRRGDKWAFESPDRDRGGEKGVRRPSTPPPRSREGFERGGGRGYRRTGVRETLSGLWPQKKGLSETPERLWLEARWGFGTRPVPLATGEEGFGRGAARGGGELWVGGARGARTLFGSRSREEGALGHRGRLWAGGAGGVGSGGCACGQRGGGVGKGGGACGRGERGAQERPARFGPC